MDPRRTTGTNGTPDTSSCCQDSKWPEERIRFRESWRSPLADLRPLPLANLTTCNPPPPHCHSVQFLLDGLAALLQGAGANPPEFVTSPCKRRSHSRRLLEEVCAAHLRLLYSGKVSAARPEGLILEKSLTRRQILPMNLTKAESCWRPGIFNRAVWDDPMATVEPATDQILNLEEASHYLRIKRRTLYTLAARGVVPAAKIGGQWRFRRSQLDSLFETGHQVTSEREGLAAAAVPTDPRSADHRK